MKLHYEKIWDVEIPDDIISEAVDNYSERYFLSKIEYSKRYTLFNRHDVQDIAERLIDHYSNYNGDYPNAFSKVLRERIREIIKERIVENEARICSNV